MGMTILAAMGGLGKGQAFCITSVPEQPEIRKEDRVNGNTPEKAEPDEGGQAETVAYPRNHRL